MNEATSALAEMLFVVDFAELSVRADWLVARGDVLGEYLAHRVNEGQHVLVIETEAECCSETWFADIVGVDALIGETVTATRPLELPDNLCSELDEDDNPRSRQEFDQLYGWELSTRKGRTTIAVRNSSNGYYGGSVTFEGFATLSEISEWEIVTEDWSALFDWCWCEVGYDCLYDRWGFGFVLSVERDSDYLLDLAGRDGEGGE